MMTFQEVKLRYVAYAVLITGLCGAYLLSDLEEADLGGAPFDQMRNASDLPALYLLENSDNIAVKRDLFALAQKAVVATKPVAVVAPPPPPEIKVDRLAELSVLGFVEQGGTQALLIQIGDEILTVRRDERFGRDRALMVDAIHSDQIRVVDQLAHVSKTFPLSED